MAPVVIPGLDVPLLTGPLVLGDKNPIPIKAVAEHVPQVFIYSEAFPKDRPGIKAVVYSMFVFESIFTLFTAIAAWNQYGVGWGDVDSLLIIDWSWEPLPALNGVLAAEAQSFYIWRIWGLTRNIWLPIVLGCVMLTQLTVAFYYGIFISVKGRGIDKLFAVSPEITVWLTTSAVCDVLISISLVYIFSRQKQESNFPRTQGIINKLIRFSVETGSITSIGAIIDVILWLTTGHKWNIHFIFWLVIGKLYSNMLMATLNARAPIFRGDAFNSTAPQSVSTFWADAPSKGQRAPLQTSGLNLHHRSGTGVNVTQTTATLRDDTITMEMDDFNTSGAGRETPDGKVPSLGAL
ncbi:hypothetical protein C8R46DRAFT_1207224 [Mycena filopes]|nr:hypothetical protein C8R46DRAFT_1207224 [Mycena filopes]